MADSAYQFIADRTPKLLKVLDGNYSLSSFLQSFYANLIYTCMNLSIDPADLGINHIFVTDSKIVVDVKFPRSKPSNRASYGKFFQRTINIEEMLRRNRKVREFLFKVVDCLSNWCSARGLELSNVRVERAIVDRSTGRVVADIVPAYLPPSDEDICKAVEESLVEQVGGSLYVPA